LVVFGFGWLLAGRSFIAVSRSNSCRGTQLLLQQQYGFMELHKQLQKTARLKEYIDYWAIYPQY